MLKNQKFAVKIGGGFALLLVLSAFVAFIGFQGLRQVKTSISGMTAAKDASISILEARREEKNFIIRGGQNYVDLVAAAVKRLDEAAAAIGRSHLTASESQLAGGIVQATRAYESAFASYVDLAGTVTSATTEWKGLGEQLVGDLANAPPDVERAFLLVRVAAVYFLKDRTADRLKDLQAAASTCTPLMERWAREQAGRAPVAARFQSYVEYASKMSDLYARQAELDAKLVEAGRIVIDNAAKLETGLEAAMNRTAAMSTILILASAGGALLLGVIIAFLLTAAITGPVTRVVSFAARIAAGDFSGRLDLEQGDEMGHMASALNDVAVKLRAVVSTIQDNAAQVASSSEQITASAQKLAEGAQSQASTLEQTSASVEELTASVDQVAEHAQSQAAAVEQGTSSMSQVQQSIEEVSKSLEQIAGLAGRSVENALEGARAVSEVADGIALIAGSSEKIGGIVTVISDIADQTNLLALNASIEAARAGEHGRGFAVVAEEVSKLADRSSSSTKEIESLIRESVKNVTRGVETARSSQIAMEQIRAASQKVKEMIGGLADSMAQQVAAVKELTGALGSVSEMSQSISAATEEQTTNAKQVAAAVESVNEVTQANASASEEMSAATEQLASMALDLRRLTAQFKVEQIEPAHPASAATGGNGNGGGSHVQRQTTIRAAEAAGHLAVAAPAPDGARAGAAG